MSRQAPDVTLRPDLACAIELDGTTFSVESFDWEAPAFKGLSRTIRIRTADPRGPHGDRGLQVDIDGRELAGSDGFKIEVRHASRLMKLMENSIALQHADTPSIPDQRVL